MAGVATYFEEISHLKMLRGSMEWLITVIPTIGTCPELHYHISQVAEAERLED